MIFDINALIIKDCSSFTILYYTIQLFKYVYNIRILTLRKQDLYFGLNMEGFIKL